MIGEEEIMGHISQGHGCCERNNRRREERSHGTWLSEDVMYFSAMWLLSGDEGLRKY